MTIGRIQVAVAVAVATAFFAVLTFIQLSISFGRQEADYWPQISHHQTLSNSSSARPNVYEDETLYLLGVGKADITGQGSNYRDLQSVC